MHKHGRQNATVSGMKVIRHAGVDSRMIILDNQAQQQLTCHFQLSLEVTIGSEESFVGMLDHQK